MVRLETADDLRNIRHLDQKLWTALACPVQGLELDADTLALIDTDGDGRVRAPQVIEAVEWACAAVSDPAVLVDGGDVLPLDAIADPAIAASAREVLRMNGRADAASIGLSDAIATAKLLRETRFNGDGVVTPASADGEETVAIAIGDAIAATGGGTPDRSGQAGIDTAGLDRFFADLSAFDAWASLEETAREDVRPLGDDTPAAAAALQAVAAKVDDFFGRCRLAAFDARAATSLAGHESRLAEVAAAQLSIDAGELADFPLAAVTPDGALPLDRGVNPAWASRLVALRDRVVTPLMGEAKQSLRDDEWLEIQRRLAGYQKWIAAQPDTTVASLGITRVRELLGSGVKEKIVALIARDLEVAAEYAAIVNVEKLLRFQRDLHRLLQNFVSFADFYDPARLSTFQAGRLLLDSRGCDLVVRVADAGKHAALAGLSKAYLAYCDCTRPATGEKMQVMAAFTNGDADNLMVGRNGIFYDRAGRDWDATITKVIENPISLRQAAFAPYKKLVRMVEEQVAKRAAEADAGVDAKLASAASSAANVDKTAKPAEPKRLDIGVVAAIGVAVTGAISAITLILRYLVDLTWWQYPLVLVGVGLLVSGPSMLIAALKLRQRNLGPILDANGWAVNGRVKINIPFGASLTTLATLPDGATRTLDDPYAEKRTPWGRYLVLLLLLLGAAYGIRLDAERHNGRYLWQDGRDQVAPESAPASTPG